MENVNESHPAIDGKLSWGELLHLIRLNISCQEDEKAERKILRARFARWAGNIVLTAVGWVVALGLILFGLIPPYVNLQFLYLALGVAYVAMLVVANRGRFRGRFNGWGNLVTKGTFLAASLLALAFAQGIVEAKEAITVAAEKAKLASLTPDERYWLKLKQEGEERKLAKEADEESNRLEHERIAANEKEAAEKRAERDKADASSREADIQEENKGQREFYDSLGAPKLLYKCNNSSLEKAYGAKVGNINLLLSNAQDSCGAAGYEVIKRKE